jgi:sphingomyelin phosphodiesterase
MNLTESNSQNTTIFQDAYQMKNLFPTDWDNLLERLQNDIDGPLMSLVHKYYRKSYDTECDHTCRRGLLCTLKSARSDDPHVCDSIPPF